MFKPTTKFLILVNYLINVYARCWFEIKSQPSFVNGSCHLYNIIIYYRNLPEEIRLIVQDNISNNAYFAHSKNILISMLTDDHKVIRELATN